MNNIIWNELVKCLLAASIERIKTFPDELNKASGRFEGADYTTWLLSREVDKSVILKPIYKDVSFGTNGYDFTLDLNIDAREVKSRISFKLKSSSNIFQKNQPTKKNPSKLGVPGDIDLKNTLGGSSKDFESLRDKFDYLLGLQIQRQNEPGQNEPEQYAGIGLIGNAKIIDTHNLDIKKYEDSLLLEKLLEYKTLADKISPSKDDKVLLDKWSKEYSNWWNTNGGVHLRPAEGQIKLKVKDAMWDSLYKETAFLPCQKPNSDRMKIMNEVWFNGKTVQYETYYKMITGENQ